MSEYLNKKMHLKEMHLSTMYPDVSKPSPKTNYFVHKGGLFRACVACSKA